MSHFESILRKALKPTLILVAGPTAIGKTAVSITLAKELNCGILSADSRQFYSEMSIGTAKPNAFELASAPHFFIGNKSISKLYSAGDFEREADAFLSEYFKENKIIILCGGSGMYINALLYGLDDLPTVSEAARQTLMQELSEKGLEEMVKKLLALDPKCADFLDLKNTQRVIRALEINLYTELKFSDLRNLKAKTRNYNIIKIGLNTSRETLYEKINTRVDIMIKQGLVAEAESLAASKDHNALKTVGYSEIYEYLDGKITLETAIEKIKQNTRRYAKRQLTWFKNKDHLTWFEPHDILGISQFIDQTIG
jgi:tRNA dimethylallyltransferase